LSPPLPFADVPLIDGHAHPMLTPAAAAAQPFARFFTEAHDSKTIAHHAPHTLVFGELLRELAARLHCAPTEAAVLAARAEAPLEQNLGELLADARLTAVLLDDGYPSAATIPIAEIATRGGVRAARVLRLERLIEEMIPGSSSLAALEAGLTDHLEAARPGLVALKSIIAYRSGLAIDPIDRGAAERSLAGLQAAWGGGPGRLEAKPLLDYLFPIAAGWAAAHRLPLQLHTGFGDRDLDLRLANPLHLRPLLEGGALSRGPVVLLHAAYPFVREAAYLASVYPNVWVDFSLVPLRLPGPGLTRVLEELLDALPVTKLLYGSDAWGVPEGLWYAARASRRALAAALGWLPRGEVRIAALRILHDNADELYGIGR
jgi:hypothetical protein